MGNWTQGEHTATAKVATSREVEEREEILWFLPSTHPPAS